MVGRRAAVLVVDDDLGFCEFISSIFENAGLDVLTAGEKGGASAAMELLRPGINQAVDEYASFPETLSRVRIERSAFPDDINVIGAAATWLNAQRISPAHQGR